MTSKWARWRLKSPATRLFTQLFIQTQIKKNIKAPLYWPLCGEFTGNWWIPPPPPPPPPMASNAENVSISWCHHELYQWLSGWRALLHPNVVAGSWTEQLLYAALPSLLRTSSFWCADLLWVMLKLVNVVNTTYYAYCNLSATVYPKSLCTN